MVQALQQQHAATEAALQAKCEELHASTQQVNIMKGQAEAARMQIADMSSHDASVMEQCVHLYAQCHLRTEERPDFARRYTSLLVNFDRNVQMYQEMYAQHQRLRDTMLASPYQRAVSSPSAPPSRQQSSAPLGWNISSPNYRDLGVVGAVMRCVRRVSAARRCSLMTPVCPLSPPSRQRLRSLRTILPP